MKRLILCLAALSSMSVFANSFCEREIKANEQMRQEALAIEGISEESRASLLQMHARSLRMIKRACGEVKTESTYNFCTSELEINEINKEQILNIENISETSRSILLKMNDTARKMIQTTMDAVCK